ncbi:MAG: TonB-dependent receptor [Saprospiraceae bacterium]|nr:TonB-dependent receptor [Saprospiraceae bacterium]
MKKLLTFNVRPFILAIIFTSLGVFASGQRTISGVLTDAQTGEALIGANILIKGTSVGTITDIDGSYSLDIPGDATTLVFSYTGYTPQEVELTDSNVIDMSLSFGEFLEEVVVIGYGTVKREDATGSIQSVSSESFNKGSITGPQELLAGKVPGVSITTGGDPGGGSKIRIRGESSLNASNDPLIVIDGVPLESGGISGARNPLNIINPNDIETFTVLKDASAAAIYGNRAAGGVILITTKKGKVGTGFKVGYTGNISFSNPYNKVDVLSADEFRTTIAEQFDADHPAHDLVGSANTDWQDEIYETAIGYDHNISLTGSVKELPYRVSIGYSDKNGILKTDNFKRLTGGLNLNPGFLDNTLQLNLHLKAMQTKNNFADRGAIGNSLSFDPTQEIYDPENQYGGYTTWTIVNGNPNLISPTNPIALLDLREDKSTVNRYIANVSADYRLGFLPDLRANLSLAYDYSKGEGTVVVPTFASFAFDELNGGGVNNEYMQVKENSLLEFYLNYKKTMGINDIDIMGGYSWQHFNVENEFTNTDAAGTPAETTAGSDPAEYYLLSLYGRVNYSYDNRYLFTFTLRRDGTSRFSPENRYGLFPAAALAVKLIDNNKEYFNNLKLRVGWGVTGQQEIGDYYAYLARYQLGFENAQYQFGDSFVRTLRPNGYDSNIRWEETTTKNIGVDFSIVKGRVSGSIDVYQRNTEDLLNRIPVPAGTNLTNFITTNVGNMENKGVEIAFNLTPVSTENLVWDFSFNTAYNKNKITKLTTVDDPDYDGILTGGIAGGVGSTIQIHSVGHAPSSFYVYEQMYDENGTLLEGEFIDQNNDGVVNGEDRIRYEKPAADFSYGFTSNLQYKDFDFSFAGRALTGNYIYNNVQTDMGYLERLYNSTGSLWNINQSALDLNVSNQGNLTLSNHFVKSASFLRVDHFTFGYDLNRLTNKNIRVYATVQNPVVVTSYDGLDPETDNGIDNNIYPRPRTFVFGLSAQF